METIEVLGADGESILFDGATVAKFKHSGKEETARNPASTYREVRVKARKRKGDGPQQYDVLLAMGSIMALRVDEDGKAALERLVAALEAARAG
jgi:hypothetical protein